LGRAHKIAAWMDEGVTGLVNDNYKPTLADLAVLGWETAARILWIKDNILSNTLSFRRDDIQCGYSSSSSSLINSDYNCSSCRQAVPSDAELTAPGPSTTSGSTDRLFKLKAIKCHLNCQGYVFCSVFFSCPSCSKSYNDPRQKLKVGITRRKRLKEMIKQAFGEETRNYEVV